MDLETKAFKLADYYRPPLPEGLYHVEGRQSITSPAKEELKITEDFYISADRELLKEEKVFSVYPKQQQRGDFRGTLPYMVLKDQSYPWLRRWTGDMEGVPVPWVALLVVSETEGAGEMDIPLSKLADMKEEGVYFPYQKSLAVTGETDTMVHLLTLPREACDAILPQAEDLPWLTHAKYVDLSDTEDRICQEDGWFSTIIANRFVPSDPDRQTALKSTIHLVSVEGYLEKGAIPANAGSVRFVSLYHWSVYSEDTEDHSFTQLIQGLGKNVKAVVGDTLLPHRLRTGEKTWSVFHSPLVPEDRERIPQLAGEECHTADARLIYDTGNGIFDVSYGAAFQLGRLLSLSRRAQTESILSWRRKTTVEQHLRLLADTVGTGDEQIEELCRRLKEGREL